MNETLDIKPSGHFVISTTDVGKRVCAARRAQHLTQEELGEQTGLTRVSINKIERGKRKQIKPDIIQKIAKATGQSVDYFYGRSAKLLSNPQIEQLPELHPQLYHAIGRLSTLPFMQQERWGHIIEELLNMG